MDITKYYAIPGEKPLDNMKPHGGFFGFFRTVACIGDSLASGEMEFLRDNGTMKGYDLYEHSWGQYMARAAGCTVYNFSQGGMTAKLYLDSFAAEKDFWNPEKKAQAYIMALGVNDILNQNQPIGSLEDVDFDNPANNNTETFAGNYCKILSKYREIEPRARFFLMTMPRCLHMQKDNDTTRWLPQIHAHRELLYQIAETVPYTYVIDLTEYGPVYDREFHKYFYIPDGHMNAAGYLLTAQMVMTYIDWIIRNHPEDFIQVPFIGKEGVYNVNYKG